MPEEGNACQNVRHGLTRWQTRAAVGGTVGGAVAGFDDNASGTAAVNALWRQDALGA